MTMREIQHLIGENIRLKSQLETKDECIKIKDEEIARKNERILYLERQLYGRRSEKQLPDYDTAQLSLFNQWEGDGLEEKQAIVKSLVEEIIEKSEERRKKVKTRSGVSEKRTYKLPSHLERIETILEPEGLNPETMVKIGEDVSERLMLEPSRFWVERTVRPIYKEKQEKESLSAGIHQAPPKETILPGCRVGSSVLSQIILDKFLYHLPEYRQVKRFKDLDIEISTSSLNRWVHDLADKLYPLYLAQVNQVLSSDYIQVDETILPVIDRPGKARKAYVWAVRSVLSPGLFFHYEKGSRSQEVVLKILKDYQGALQTDGYAAYSIYEDKSGVLPLGCLAHVRRKFETAFSTFPQAQEALDYIALLYMLEGNMEAEHLNYEEIRSQRQEKAYPILQQMERWMKKTINTCTPNSTLAKALKYAFGMWPRVSRYCKDGRFQIDNNGIENAIRPIALGRKNYLFAGNNSGAEDNCVFYSLIGSCEQAGINPHRWLSQTLDRIPKLQTPINWEELLPANGGVDDKT